MIVKSWRGAGDLSRSDIMLTASPILSDDDDDNILKGTRLSSGTYALVLATSVYAPEHLKEAMHWVLLLSMTGELGWTSELKGLRNLTVIHDEPV